MGSRADSHKGGAQVRRQHRVFWILGIFFFLPCEHASAQVITFSNVDVVKTRLAEARASLENLKGAISMLEGATRDLVAEIRSFPLERLIVDASIAFEGGSYKEAAILYREAIEFPGFKGQPGYAEALFRLAESLFQLGNDGLAMTYFEQVCEQPENKFREHALKRLVETCTKTRYFVPCERKENMFQSIATPEFLYEYGKYLYRRGAKEKAMEVFGRIPNNSKNFGRARYFMGVIAIGAGNLDAALQYFGESASSQAEEESEVRALALLALARVHFQKGQYQEALKFIQSIPPSASCFLESQIDLAWIYLRLDDTPRAVTALDVVLMGGTKGPLALSAQALKSRILGRSKDADKAKKVYESVVEALDPVAHDLERLSRDPKLIERYFAWVLSKDSAAHQGAPPISKNALEWLEEDETLKEVTLTLQDVGAQEKILAEGVEKAERLVKALRSDEMMPFPAVKENYLRTKALENNLAQVALSVAREMEAVLLGRLEGEVLAQYQQAVSNRKRAQEDFGKVPSDLKAIKRREERADAVLRDIEIELFRVETVIEMEQRQLVTMEEWLLDAKARRAAQLTPEKEKEFRDLLEIEKKNLEEISEVAKSIRRDLEQTRITISGRTGFLRDDERARSSLWEALLWEASALKTVAQVEGGEVGSAAKEAAEVIEECLRQAERAQEVGGSLERLAKERAAEVERIVTIHKQRLGDVLAELKKLELDSLLFAKTEGGNIIRAAADKIYSVLLEADLGTVDLALRRVQSIKDSLLKASREQSEREERLKAAEDMLKTSSGEEVEGKKQEDRDQ